jgi:hypothetical protein
MFALAYKRVQNPADLLPVSVIDPRMSLPLIDLLLHDHSSDHEEPVPLLLRRTKVCRNGCVFLRSEEIWQ